jgi:hypothetical protein
MASKYVTHFSALKCWNYIPHSTSEPVDRQAFGGGAGIYKLWTRMVGFHSYIHHAQLSYPNAADVSTPMESTLLQPRFSAF